MGLEGHGVVHKLWRIEREKQRAVVAFRIPLRQHKRLSANTVLIYVTQIQTGVEPVIPTTGEYEPAAGRIPIVETLRVFAVHFINRPSFSGLQVEQPEVGLMVPD